jgi:hypothetical protein
MNKLLQRLKFDQVSNLEKLLQVCRVEFNLLGELLTMKYRTDKEYEQGQDIYMFVYHVREENKNVYDVIYGDYPRSTTWSILKGKITQNKITQNNTTIST